MNASLVTALIGLAGLVLGSSTTMAAFSPASRRLKRLGQLVELRPSVEDAETRHRIDYAMERLAHQIAEDAVAIGDRASGRRTFMHWGVIVSGLALVSIIAFRVGNDPGAWHQWVLVIFGMLVAFSSYIALLSGFAKSPKKYAATVEKGLTHGRHHERSQPSGAEGVAEGDVPSA